MKKNNPLKPLNEAVLVGEKWVIIFGFTAMLILGLLQIVLRKIGYPIPWVEPVMLYVFIWTSMLAMSFATAKGSHFKMEMLTERLSPKGRKTIRIIVNLIILFFGIFIVFYGMQNAIMNLGQRMMALPFSMFVPKLSVPIAFSLSIVHALSNLIDLLQENEIVKVEVMD